MNNAIKENFEYIQNDYIKYNYSKKYDAIVSALYIHHLTNEDKQLVFDKSYSLLKPGVRYNGAIKRNYSYD